MTPVFILGGARTPFGRFLGGLRDHSATELGTIAARGACEKTGVAPGAIDLTVMGNVIQSSADAVYLARHVALGAGVGEAAPALTVNRLCGSGLQAVVSAAQALVGGEGDLALAGGTESMSQAPYAIRGARLGWGLGQGEVGDTLWECLTDTGAGCTMAQTAENIARDMRITREEEDAFSLLSHERALASRDAFAEEIVPVGRVTQDEHPRETSLEKLASLPLAFPGGSTVTAGNASGINDGAAALVIATEAGAQRAAATPIARILGWAVAGVDPTRMGLGPVPAIRILLERTGLALADIDLFEVNEAFAAQYIGVERILGLPRERVNVHGGAVALGHPVGASGARLLLTLALEMKRRGVRRGIASLCIGGGQGIAMAIESVA